MLRGRAIHTLAKSVHWRHLSVRIRAHTVHKINVSWGKWPLRNAHQVTISYQQIKALLNQPFLMVTFFHSVFRQCTQASWMPTSTWCTLETTCNTFPSWLFHWDEETCKHNPGSQDDPCELLHKHNIYTPVGSIGSNHWTCFKVSGIIYSQGSMGPW